MNTEYLLAVFHSRQQAAAFWSNLRRFGCEAAMISVRLRRWRRAALAFPVRFAARDLPIAKAHGGWQSMTAFDGFYCYDGEKRRFMRLRAKESAGRAAILQNNV